MQLKGTSIATMSLTKIEKLTPEQKALIPFYREKWIQIALSTKPINHQEITDAVKAAYFAIGELEPEILFFDSPHAALNQVEKLLWNPAESPIWRELQTQVESFMWRELRNQLNSQVVGYLWKYLCEQLESSLWGRLKLLMERQLESLQVSPLPLQISNQLTVVNVLTNSWHQGWLAQGSLCDFCISVLNCEYELRRWKLFQSIVKNCGWIFPFEKTCIICNRPIKLSFDNQQRLHAELGEPAVQYADGLSLYSYHGLKLPEKYGKLSPSQWQAQWIIEEKNVERRQLLIQHIGFTRICQELQAEELDSWKEYTLLRLGSSFDVYISPAPWGDHDAERVPTYLLKMTCPSTGKIHALRVPHELKSAREAIRWVNWGVDPEEFSVQT